MAQQGLFFFIFFFLEGGGGPELHLIIVNHVITIYFKEAVAIFVGA